MEESARDRLVRTPVVLDLPGTADVDVTRDVLVDGQGEPVLIDRYSLRVSADAERRPIVAIIAGYPDAGFERMLGCRFKDMASTTSWARLIAASGMITIAYANRDPERDLDRVLDYVQEKGTDAGIDPGRIALFATSGNGPLAFSRLGAQKRPGVRAAVFCYAYIVDLDGGTAVADASRAFRFVSPAAGQSPSDLRDDVAILVVRAGRDDTPRLNESLDTFVAAALRSNVPLTVVNHPTGPHAFDLFERSAASRAVVRQVLGFLRAHLLTGSSAAD